MSSAYFSTVTVLELATSLTFYYGERIYHSFNRFMSHFSAVETLKIDEEGIFILTQYIETDESEAPLFPMLRYLTVSKMDFNTHRKRKCHCKYHPGRFSGSIEQFLKWRSNRSMPNIQILSLDRTSSESPKYEDPSGRGMRSLDPALDELAGMKVVWKFEDRVVEYECGSGFPERLKYDEIYRHCEIWNRNANFF
ncbi:hypothetical protein JR316_0008401 [Psilocybe cubensis]|uniref:Uncharacterized protein n=2 Tax=Psilocybe cubensis TaxID=181762 RepID=A0ACB8GW55_PSICU|nr:hypothetical protein JR316_0008401 [Psilocybe cubensis]KAH9479806.1 hypothetical protein JR316_0008401 [Psilocybe cubensis]